MNQDLRLASMQLTDANGHPHPELKLAALELYDATVLHPNRVNSDRLFESIPSGALLLGAMGVLRSVLASLAAETGTDVADLVDAERAMVLHEAAQAAEDEARPGGAA